MSHRTGLALALSLLCTTTAWADFRADYAPAKGSDGNPTLSRIELSGQQMRMDAGNVSMLFDIGSGKMIVLMHDKHQFMDMEKVAQTVSSSMAKANAALANLPPEQRAMIEQRMGGHLPGASAPPATVSITPTGAKDRVGNYACEVYRTDVNGKHHEDSCLANVADAGISGGDQATLRKAFAQLKTLSEKMSSGLVKSPVADMPADRFPVRISRLDDQGHPAVVAELQGVSNGTPPAADFAIPAGYTEQDMGSMGHHH